MTFYQKLLDEAMLGIVKKVLTTIQTKGLEMDQSFYISFRTASPGVLLSNRIRSKYPEEITVVLQYQFRNLIVKDDMFSVNIAFGGIPETIQVPFDSLTSFVDPAENFSLQFRNVLENQDSENENMLEKATILNSDISKKNNIDKNSTQKTNSTKKTNSTQKPGKVIALDKFRLKKK